MKFVQLTLKTYSNIRLWSSEDASFESGIDTPLGSPDVDDPGNFTADFSSFTSSITTSETYYFVSADVASDATGSIQGSIHQNSHLVFDPNVSPISETISDAALSSTEVPTPITLASFVANANKGSVELAWTTASETENSHFLVYRDDAVIGRVAGNGTCTDPHNYTFVDNMVEPGVHEYAIEDVTYGGEAVMHDKVEVEVKLENASFTLNKAYPNPFNPRVVLSMEYGVGSDAVLNIYNTQGVLVDQLINGFVEAGSHELTWDAANMPSGIYVVRMVAGDVMYSQKVVLMK